MIRIFLQETYVIEDCNYYNTAEISLSTTASSAIYDNNLSQVLPNKCEISYDGWSNNTYSTSEHRFFLLPKSQFYSGTTQPTYALCLDMMSNHSQLCKREDGSTISILDNLPSIADSNYHRIKYVRDGTNISMYIDNVLKTTANISWIDNYSDYCLSMTHWRSSNTSKIKNVKFKVL